MGGGLVIGGTATLTNVTVSNNTAAGNPRVPVNGGGSGGGIVVFSGTTAPTNATVSQNTAAAGGGGSLPGTGGGIAQSGGTVNLKNSIVENNGPTQCAGTITSQDDNLSQGTACGFSAALHDLNNPVTPDPLLGTLQLNPPNPSVGTPGNNLTVALLPGSLAVDGVQHNTCPLPTSDERGVPRPQGPRCDIGAFELQPTATSTRTATSTVTPTSTRSPTATASPAITNTPTRAPTPTATPYPRPNVGVQVAPGGGTLQTTITARDAGCAQGNNQLQSLQFTRLTNATVDVGSPPLATVARPTTVPLPAHPATMPLTAHRTSASQAVTVELTVTDGCGAWPTFVGGGPNAF
ncbi:MAG TPA: choice-of-anchor Q domain-containing protein [Chloroflexota bacterium]|jgi:hypothetical protein